MYITFQNLYAFGITKILNEAYVSHLAWDYQQLYQDLHRQGRKVDTSVKNMISILRLLCPYLMMMHINNLTSQS